MIVLRPGFARLMRFISHARGLYSMGQQRLSKVSVYHSNL